MLIQKIKNYLTRKIAPDFNFDLGDEYKNALLEALSYSSMSTNWYKEGEKSGGWFHNINLCDDITSFSRFGARPSVSIASPNIDEYPRELYEYIFSILKMPPYSMVLEDIEIVEIGPAEGYGVLKLAEKNKVTAVDLSRKHLYRLALLLMYYRLEKKCHLIHSDVLNFVKNNEFKFDLCICLGVLYHLSDLETGGSDYLASTLKSLLKISKTFVFEIYYFENENLDILFTKRDKKILIKRGGNKTYLDGGFALNKKWLENYFDLKKISWKSYPRKNPSENFDISAEYIDNRIIYVCTA